MSWVRPADLRGEPQARLFCFPYAGGSSSFYRPWAPLLPPGVGLCPVLMPGREERLNEAPLRDVATLADRIAAELRPALDRPFAFFGHSLGAIVAFEVARRLWRTAGQGPAILFASGSEAPDRHSPASDSAALSDDAFLALMKSLGGTPDGFFDHPELVELLLPALRADFAASDSYVFTEGPALPTPIVVLTGTQDRLVTLDEAAAWKRHTSGAFRLKRFPGDHFFPSSARTAVLRELGADLAGVSRPS